MRARTLPAERGCPLPAPKRSFKPVLFRRLRLKEIKSRPTEKFIQAGRIKRQNYGLSNTSVLLTGSPLGVFDLTATV